MAIAHARWFTGNLDLDGAAETGTLVCRHSFLQSEMVSAFRSRLADIRWARPWSRRMPDAVNENKLFFRIHHRDSRDVVETPRIRRVCASEQAATSPLPRDSRPASTRRPF